METKDIEIRVDTLYLRGNSSPSKDEYQFAYTITIHNRGSVGAQLLRRHWLIRDDSGRQQEVRGEGVVGEQPHLLPGESYQYTSGTILKTPHGTMEGSYEWVVDGSGALMHTPIAPFYLTVPRVLH